MSDRQRESTAKFLYDMAKGVGLIAVVGGMVSGQVNWWSVILGLFGMSTFFLMAYWLEGRETNDATTHLL
jgi:fucose 4-O-acetylase-like acetyltransferase